MRYTFVCVALYQHIANFKLQIKCSKCFNSSNSPIFSRTISCMHDFKLPTKRGRENGVIFSKCSNNGLFIFILNCMNNFFFSYAKCLWKINSNNSSTVNKGKTFSMHKDKIATTITITIITHKTDGNRKQQDHHYKR